MKKFYTALRLVFILIVISCSGLSAQNDFNVQYQLPSGNFYRLSVCGDAQTHTIRIQNISGEDLKDVNVKLNLPTGLFYTTGSLTGPATEVSSTPAVFNAGDFAIGEVKILVYDLDVNCNGLALALSSSSTNYSLDLCYIGGDAEQTNLGSPNFEVVNPVLSFPKVIGNNSTSNLFDAAFGLSDTLKVDVVNGGEGSLREFTYCVINDHPYLTLNKIVVAGQDVPLAYNSPSGDRAYFIIDANEIANAEIFPSNPVQDPNLFQFNEKLVVCEVWETENCPDTDSVIPDIQRTAFYGCDGIEICQQTPNSFTGVRFGTLGPAIQAAEYHHSFDYDVDYRDRDYYSDCYSNGENLTHQFVIINRGLANMKLKEFDLTTHTHNYYYIPFALDETSVKMFFKDGPLTTPISTPAPTTLVKLSDRLSPTHGYLVNCHDGDGTGIWEIEYRDQNIVIPPGDTLMIEFAVYSDEEDCGTCSGVYHQFNLPYPRVENIEYSDECDIFDFTSVNSGVSPRQRQYIRTFAEGTNNFFSGTINATCWNVTEGENYFFNYFCPNNGQPQVGASYDNNRYHVNSENAYIEDWYVLPEGIDWVGSSGDLNTSALTWVDATGDAYPIYQIDYTDHDCGPDTVKVRYRGSEDVCFDLRQSKFTINTTPDCGEAKVSFCSKTISLAKHTFYVTECDTDGSKCFEEMDAVRNHTATIHGCECNPCEGMVFTYLDISRQTFGDNDPDNDGIIEPGNLDVSIINKGRFITGDTIRASYGGWVNLITKPNFEYAYATINVPIIGSGVNALGDDGITPLSAMVSIWDQSSGGFYQCDLVQLFPDGQKVVANLSVQSLKDLGCSGMPADFVYEQGDSIAVDFDFRLKDFTTSQQNVSFGSEYYMTDEAYDTGTHYQCNTLNQTMTYIPYRAYNEWVYREIGGCNDGMDNNNNGDPYGSIASVYDSHRNLFRLGSTNFDYFPYEVRQIAKITQQTYINKSDLDWGDEFKILVYDNNGHLTETGGSLSWQRYTLNMSTSPCFAISGNTLVVDFECIYDEVGYERFDEGMDIYCSPTLSPTCKSEYEDGGTYKDIEVYTDYDMLESMFCSPTWTAIDTSIGVNEGVIDPFNNSLTPQFMHHRSSIYTGDYIKLTELPNITLQPNSVNQTLYEEEACFNVDVSNTGSGPAQNVFFTLENISGGIIFQGVNDAVTGASLPVNVGVVNLGTLDVGETRALEFCVTSNNCDRDSILINTGWDCVGLPTSPDEADCTSPVTVYLEIPNSELGMIVQSPDPTLPFVTDLCEEVEYVVQLSSSDIGALHDINFQFNIPTGMDFVPGSFEMAYPVPSSGPPTWVTTGNQPTNTSGSQYNIILDPENDLLADNGLPGTTDIGNNFLLVRFKTFVGCGSFSGSRVRFLSWAYDPCDKFANYRFSPGPAIKINGVSDSYVSSLSVPEDELLNACEGNNVELGVNFSLAIGSLPIGPTDSVMVELPFGINYVPNSYTPNSNAAPASSTNPRIATDNGAQTVFFDLLDGVMEGETIDFTFEVSAEDVAQACREYDLVIRTFNSQVVYCEATDEFCDVKTTSDEVTAKIEIVKPDLDISNLEISTCAAPPDMERLAYCFDITNSGSDVVDGTTTVVEFYSDQNNNGDFDNGVDVLLSGVSTTLAIANGETLTVCDTTLVPSGMTCNIIAVINPEATCACSINTSFRAHATLDQKITENEWSVCSNTLIENIGPATLNNVTYEWVGIDGASTVGFTSTTTTPTNYQFENTTGSIIEWEYYLRSISNNDCAALDTIKITIYPEEHGTVSLQACPFDEFNLAGPEGNTDYQWSPSIGLTDDNAANTNVDASRYSEGVHTFVLTYTDKNGCPGDFTAEVTIVPCALTYVGNYVWCDDNNNGVQDDIPIEGVTVQLFGSTDPTMPIATTQTDANGAYLFGPIPQGEYIVGVDLASSNYQVAMKDVTTDDLDNDLNSNFQTDAFYLSNGDSLTTIDLGLLCPVVDLEIEKTAVTDKTTGLLEAVALGDTVFWTIEVCNRTMAPDTVNFAADSVQVTELLPTGIRYLSHTVTQGDYDPVSGIWDVERIPNGNCPRLCIASDITLDLLPITNTTEITYGADPDIDSTPDNDNGDQSEDDEDNAIISPRRMDLALTKRVSTTQMLPVEAGDNVTYTIAVCNQGNVPAYNIEVVDYIPAGMNLNDTDWTPGGVSTEAFIEIPGPLALNVCTSVDITLMIDPAFAGDTLTNFAEISSQEYDDGTFAPDIDSNTDSDPANDGPVTDQQINNANNDEDDHDPAGVHVTMIQCAAGNNGPVCPGGSVTLQENGGDASVWSWTGPGGFTSTLQNPEVSPALPGIYTVSITDPNGFIEICETEVNLLPGIEVNGLASDVSCHMGTNGSIDINVSGGTAPYLYDWSNDGSEDPDNDNQDLNNLSSGNYTVTVTDILGCTSTAGFFVSQPTAVSCNAIAQDAQCNGESSGTITVVGSGGTAPYEFSINGGPYQPSGVFSDMSAGNYNIAIRDANNCVSICSAVVSQPAAISCSLTGTDVTDCELQDGVINVSGTGGTAPYTYAINNGSTQSSNTFTGLMAGMHTVELTDINGCSTTCEITLTAPTVPTCQITSFENIDCHGASTGSITVSGSGGISPYEYSLDNSNYQSSSTFSGLAAGLHIIYVRNVNSPMCVTMCSMVLTEPTLLLCELNGTNVSCLNGSDGSVTVNATGGVTPYEYSLNGGAWQPGSNFSGLTAGSHMVTVRDANACTSSCTVVIMEPELLVCNITGTDALCAGTATGMISVMASGGVSPYEYSINNGPWQVSNLFMMLNAGNHLITTRDDNGCTTSCSVFINEPELLSCSTTGMDLTDCMLNDGKVTVSVTGGTAPFTYSLDGGSDQNSNMFTGLMSGMHNIQVTDNNGCTTTCQVTLESPTAPDCSITSFGHISCREGNDGFITVLATGGNTPYEYSLDNSTYQNSGTFNGLTAGFHNIYVRNMANPMCITMCGMELVEPTLLICDHTQTAVSCNGGSDAMISVNATGGITPYEYSLNGSAWQPGFVFGNLAAGDHIVVVRDANLCIATCLVTINEPSSLTCSLVSADATCNGAATGAIASSAAGGVGSYEYSVNNGPWQQDNQFVSLAAGDYTVTVRDENDCTSTCSITIDEPGLLNCSLEGTDITDCAVQDGTITVTATSGTAPYTYNINAGEEQSGNIFTGLIAGTHTVTVIDDNGCMSTCEITLGAPTTPICEISSFTHIDCNGEATGSVTATATGGVLPHEFSLDNVTFQLTGTFTGLSAGTHTVYVRNVGSPMCISMCSMELTEPTLLVCNHEQENVTCFEGDNGSVSINATGGVTAYEYSLNGSPWQPGNSFDGLTAGSYNAIVRDANGCTTTCGFSIEEPTDLVCNLTKTDVLCNGDGTGSISASANGGVLPYVYSLQGSPWQSGTTFLNVAGGTYTVSVRDANECISTCEITIEEPAALTCELDYIKPESCAFNDGEISVDVLGGTLPLMFSIDDGATFQSSMIFTGLSNGNYTILSRDGNGCEIECNFTVEPDCFDLALEKELVTAPPYVYGQLVSFDITVTNQGNIDATDIEITEHLPCGFTYDPTSLINLSNDWTPLVTANPMTTIESLSVGTSATVRIELTVEQCTEPDGYLNVSEISDASDPNGDPIDDVDSNPDYNPDNDPESEDDHDTELLPIYDPALTKKLITPTPYNYGDVLLFEIEVCNQNANEITNISVVDYMPAGYTFDAALNPDWILNVGNVLSTTYSSQILQGGECAKIPLNLILEMGEKQDWHNIAEIQQFTDQNGNPQLDTDATNDRDNGNDGDMVDDEVNNTDGDEDDSDYAEPLIIDAALVKTTSDTGPFVYGDVVTFDIKVYNQGNSDIYNITLNDALPCGFKYLLSNDSNWSYDAASLTANTTLNGLLAAGDSAIVSIDLEIVECHDAEAYLNIAEIQSFENQDGDDISDADIDSNADGDTSNDVISDNTIDNTDNDEDDHDPEKIDIFDLAQIKKIITPMPYAYGDLLEYSICVVNQGNVPAQNITIADYLPEGLGFDTALNLGWDASNAPRYDYLISGPLVHGDTICVAAFMSIDMTMGGGNDHTNISEITSAENQDGEQPLDADSTADNDPDNDGVVNDNSFDDEEDDHDIADLMVVDAALAKTTDNDDPFRFGDLIVFNIEVSNQGNIELHNVKLNDFIPCGFSYESTNDGVWSYDGNGIATTTISGPIAGGEMVIVPITLKLQECADAQAWKNIAEIESFENEDGDDITLADVDSDGDSDPTNDGPMEDDTVDNTNNDEDDSDFEEIEIFDLALEKELLTQLPYGLGDLLEFQFAVINEGNVPAYNINVADHLPAGFIFNPADNPGWMDTNAPIYNYVVMPVLEPGDTTYVSIFVTIQASFGGEIDYINTGEITSAEDKDGDPRDDVDSTPDDDPDNDSEEEDDHDQESVILVDMALVKTTNTAGPYAYGDIITFDFEIINQGVLEVYEIKVNDFIPCGYEYVATNDSNWTFDESQNLATTMISGPIAGGMSETISIDLKLIACNPSTSEAWTNIAEIESFEDEDGNDITTDDVDSNGDNDPSNDVIVNDVFDNKDGDEDDSDIETLEIFDLALQKTANVPGTNVSLGDTVEYIIHVYNQGNIIAEKIEIIDYLEAPLLFDPTLNGGWTLVSEDLEYTADGPLLPGQDLQIPLYLVVDPAAIGFAEALNFAEITGVLDDNGNDRTDDDIDSQADQNQFNDVGGIPEGDSDDHILDNGFDADGDGVMDEDDHDPARIIIFDCHDMLCTGVINLSLDNDCTSVITPRMILDPDIDINDDTFYTIEITDAGGNMVTNQFDATDIGMTFLVTITINPPVSAPDCATNSCTSMVTVEDKWMPSIECGPAIDVACNALSTVMPPVVLDNCGDVVAVLVNESEVVYDCDLNYLRTITRTYKAVDAAGNESASCDQVINVLRVDLSAVSFPGHFISEVCTTSTDPEVTGVPTFAGFAIYPDVPDVLCNVSVNFEDINLSDNGCNKTFTRIWRVTEWHCGTTVGPMQWVQEVTVTDKTGPSITCPSDFTMSTDQSNGSCMSAVNMPGAIVNDDCNNPVDVNIIGGTEVIFNNGGTTMLPVGTTIMTYVAYDDCYNSTTCQLSVTVTDETQPTVLCKLNLVASISSNGLATVNADVFDNGSFDDCLIDRFEVARMDDPCGVSGTTLGENVTFCCADVGNQVMVMFRVYDSSGNFNDCMVSVEVQDKEEATISCPADETVECTTPYDLGNLSLQFGVATVGDNCSNQSITESVVENIDQCGLGTIERTFTIPDGVGGTVSCTQMITFVNSDPFDGNDPVDLMWPQDLTIDGMCMVDDVHPDNLNAPFDYPVINEDQCDMVGATFTDQVFEFIQGEDACFKVLRTWRVVDWCNRLPTGLFETYEHEQIIKVTNSIAPSIVSGCTDQVVETQNCDEETVVLEITATDDCTSAEGLLYSFAVDIFSDGSINYTANSNVATALYPLGVHTITWTVMDGCGNQTSCTHTFEVVSTKAPAAVCQSLTAPLIMMDTDGDGMPDTEMVIINAADFDASSTHPCGYDISFSFSADPTDTEMIFDCDQQGQQGIMFWVTDEKGNQAFCNTFVIITDPDNSCPQMTNVDIQGRIFTEDNENVEAAGVKLLGSLEEAETSEQGNYQFDNMPMGGAYIVDPEKNDDVDNGVSTLDLVLIQKHLLQLQTLSSPYKLIAADINHDEKISALDLIQLRKLILGVTDEFPNNDSWRFIDALYEFPLPTDPWLEVFPEDYEIPALNTNMSANFIGVKIGDVNGSVEANFESVVVEKRSNNPIELRYQDQVVEKGDRVELNITGDVFKDISGMQFTLNHKGLDLEDIEAERLDISEVNIGRLASEVTSFSWNDNSGNAISTKSTELFTFNFIATQRLRLSDVISITSIYTEAEAYQLVTNDDLQTYVVIDVILSPESVTEMEQVLDFVLTQNEPNPWSQITTISVNSQITGTAILTLKDALGRIVISKNVKLLEGNNDITLTKNEIGASGMYFYSLTMDDKQQTKQMIKIE